MQQSAQSSLGCREGRGKVVFGLCAQQTRNSLSCVRGKSFCTRYRPLHRLAGNTPKPIDNLELLSVLHYRAHPFPLLPRNVLGIFPLTDASGSENYTSTRLPRIPSPG